MARWAQERREKSSVAERGDSGARLGALDAETYASALPLANGRSHHLSASGASCALKCRRNRGALTIRAASVVRRIGSTLLIRNGSMAVA